MREGLCSGWAAVASFTVGCSSELVAEVPPEVCYSRLQWIGGKHGDEEMYPGRDCVGCHRENDGPPLVIGGTIYPYVLDSPEEVRKHQSGIDCFGIGGIQIRITDARGDVYDLVTNRAGSFFIEGEASDFAMPLAAQIFTTSDQGTPLEPQMNISPSYGGCARCHDPLQPPPASAPDIGDPDARFVTARIGLPGYRDAEVRALVADP